MWAAYCAGCVPVGAAAIDTQGRVLAIGRNRIFQFEEEGGFLYGQTLAHAELNALIRLPVDGPDRYTCALYTTMEPCPLCLGALYMSGVRRLHYACRDPYTGSVDLLGATPYLRRKPIQVFWPELKTILIALHTEYELGFGLSQATRRLLETGERLYQREWLLARRCPSRGNCARCASRAIPPHRYSTG